MKGQQERALKSSVLFKSSGTYPPRQSSLTLAIYNICNTGFEGSHSTTGGVEAGVSPGGPHSSSEEVTRIITAGQSAQCSQPMCMCVLRAIVVQNLKEEDSSVLSLLPSHGKSDHCILDTGLRVSGTLSRISSHFNHFV